jgi:ACS family allantoate permease-like MFS transporter
MEPLGPISSHRWLACILCISTGVSGVPHSESLKRPSARLTIRRPPAPYVVGISLPQANTAGQTKKAVCYSLVQIGYATGNLIGPQTFLSNQAPKYTGAVIAMLTCYCVCILIMLAYFALGTWENKQRDRQFGKPQEIHEGTAEGFVDVTDKEQPDFRYTT